MNKKQITGIVLLSLIAAGLAPLAAHAASPRRVTTTGVPFKWDNSKSITYNIDQGPLGKMSNSKAAALVEKAFQQWSSVDTAKLTFEEGDPLDRDVTGANLGDFLSSLPSDVNPIIFDNDGSITEANAGRDVLAFGVALQTTPTGLIAQGVVVINGRAVDGLFDPDDPAPDDLTRAVVRAIGEMLGVGPSDTNDELIFDGIPANNSAVPIMHPATGVGNILGGGFAPTLDDRMAVSALYPAATFDSSTGIIRGKVLLADGTTGLQGIAVIAHKMDDPVNSAVSAISGVTFRNRTGRGADDPSLRGAFEIHVPPGSYTLEFRPLRANIGPFGAPFPLPGGRQFYQAAGGSPAPTAGPVPASATPITVTAGQATEVNFTAPGKPAPAAQTVTQVKPDDSPADAQLLPLSATVTGNVSPMDPGEISIALGQDSSGKFVQDKVENLYRLVVPERSILTLYLQPKDKVDLALYVLHGFLGGANPEGTGALSVDTGAKALQLDAGPGTYLLGVSAWDNVQHPAATDYTLSVTTTPLGDLPSLPAPVLNQLVLGDVTDKSATASWITDQDTTGDVIVALPRQEFGDPMASKAHHVPVAGLMASTDADLIAISQTPDGVLSNLPRVFFHTADSTAATGAANVSAFVVGALSSDIGTGDTVQTTMLVEIGIHNTGGPASNVEITGLTASPGWKLAQPVTQPLMIGGIGTNGTAVAVVRLLRDGTGPAPLATVTGTGTLAGAGGAAANFTISGP